MHPEQPSFQEQREAARTKILSLLDILRDQYSKYVESKFGIVHPGLSAEFESLYKETELALRYLDSDKSLIYSDEDLQKTARLVEIFLQKLTILNAKGDNKSDPKKVN